uniref:Uncharacterized protein n=1 Tax=Rubinisphaera brasiliensis (strain ATCC 49424 / DSM 5305 / JCM 21570 / IAM 15109 / NBRC 103401 / IFAM 1448) TaxID=756272 RepID=F0SKI5_RUBBR|nr:hypothetical protein Plabr_4393 [Rubinisphaera brasiliensis DSM 5305]
MTICFVTFAACNDGPCWGASVAPVLYSWETCLSRPNRYSSEDLQGTAVRSRYEN